MLADSVVEQENGNVNSSHTKTNNGSDHARGGKKFRMWSDSDLMTGQVGLFQR